MRDVDDEVRPDARSSDSHLGVDNELAGSMPLREPPAEVIRNAGGHGVLHSRLAMYFLRVVTLVVIFASWQLCADHGIVNKAFTSRPSDVWTAFWHNVAVNRSFWPLARVTLYETVVGYVAAVVIGVLVGILFYEVPLVERIGRPFMNAINSAPRLALAPLFVFWFGLGSLSQFVLVFSMVFFIILFNTYAGLGSCSRDYLQLARSLGVSRVRTFWSFTLRAAIPTIFAGLQLGLIFGLLAAVAGEMFNGSGGLGYELQFAMTTYRTETFFAALLFLILISVLISGLMRLLEMRLLRWQRAEYRGLRRQI